MSDLISRKEAIKALELCAFARCNDWKNAAILLFADSAKEWILQIPSAERPGKWEPVQLLDGEVDLVCSNCKTVYTGSHRHANYCPNCGARMVKDE